MSRVLTMRGVRGGCGATTLLAALGWALHEHGQRVLLLELCPAGMLGLHVGLPVSEPRGWARAVLDGGDWREQAFAVSEGLALLPYGGVDAGDVPQVDAWLTAREGWWPQRLAGMSGEHDWILVDLPHASPINAEALAGANAAGLALTVVTVDPACHVALHRRAPDGLVLANRYDPSRQLQRDLVHLWQRGLGARLVPQLVHEDAVVPEALAMKQPVGRFMPDALAAADAAALAVWCIARAARMPAEGA